MSKNMALEGVLDDHEVSTDIDNKAEYEVKHLIADVNWNIGEGNLRVITGWRDTFVGGELDGDGQPNPVPMVHSNAPWAVDQDQLSAEIRYFTPVSDMAELTVGLYYFEQDVEYSESRALNLGRPTDPVNVGAGAELDHKSYAVFAQSDISLTDSLTLTLGTRYTDEEKDAEVASFGSCDTEGQNCSYDFVESDDWNFVSGYAGLKYQIADNAHSYVSWTRSFRSGGFNLRNTLPSIPGPYDEEQLDAYELGFKSDWMDKRLRFNAAIFHNKFEDLQRTVVINDPNTGVRQDKLNAADATIQGVELELTLFIQQNLRLDVSGGYVDAEYDRFVGSDTSLALANVPERNGNISLTHNLELSGGELESRVSATYTDSQFATVDNSIELDSFTVYDASIGYVFADDSTRISLFGKNLGDKEYTNFALAGLNTLWAISPPRTYGVELSYKY